MQGSYRVAGPRIRAGMHRAARLAAMVAFSMCVVSLPCSEALSLPGGGGNPFAKAVAAFQGLLKRNQPERPPQLSEVRNKFEMDKGKLFKIRDHMLFEMQDGLTQGSTSPMLMLPTHITSLPSGKEKGTYLALDLGGTNFRVLRVVLDGNGKCQVESKKWTVPMELLTAPGEDLFAFLAKCVAEVAPETIGAAEAVPMGFTFSFPVEQSAINVGKLVTWVKGFKNSGVEGEDVVALLNAALKKENVSADVKALINDTPGTLLAGALKEPKAACGLILGTGTNLCFIDKVSRIAKLQKPKPFHRLPSVATWCVPPYVGPSEEHVVNTEWGGFDSGKETKALPMTKYDCFLDSKSSNPKEHLYEKMISGMYLGEIARLVCMDLIAAGVLFHGQATEPFITTYGFETADMSAIEASSSIKDVQAILRNKFSVEAPTDADCTTVKDICSIVSTRAARLTAAGIAAVAVRLNKEKDMVVAVDGSVFEKYPKFQDKMRQALKEILGADMGVRFIAASDGSGVGAALAAAY